MQTQVHHSVAFTFRGILWTVMTANTSRVLFPVGSLVCLGQTNTFRTGVWDRTDLSGKTSPISLEDPCLVMEFYYRPGDHATIFIVLSPAGELIISVLRDHSSGGLVCRSFTN